MAPHESDMFFEWAYAQMLFNKSLLRVSNFGHRVELACRQNISAGEITYDILDFELNGANYNKETNERFIDGWQLAWSTKSEFDVYSLVLTDKQQALVQKLYESILEDEN